QYLYMHPLPTCSTLFPYTTLFRSVCSDSFSPLSRWGDTLSTHFLPNSVNSSVILSCILLWHSWHKLIKFKLFNFKSGICSNGMRSEEHTSELQSRENLVCRLLLEK